MLVAAALIELVLPPGSGSGSIKDRRRVAKAVKDRLCQRFNISVAEVGDPEDRHCVCIGCVMVGINPDHLRNGMEKVLSYVDGLGLAEVVSDDITIIRLDEVEEMADEGVLPDTWSKE